MNPKCETTETGEALANAPAAKHTILLVDDDPGIRKILFRLLVEEHFRVLTAANGFEALDVAHGDKPDLVLLDLNMPGKDGWETFAQLSAENPLLPIILITARPNQFFTALSAGVGALMEKPLDFVKLFQTINRLLSEPAEASLARYAGKAGVFEYAPSGTAAK
jgi:two-component system response regulator (stage 0 sporulation protein F)